jgi:hypothetical protein
MTALWNIRLGITGIVDPKSAYVVDSRMTQTRPVSRDHSAVAAREGPVDTVTTHAHHNPPDCRCACALHHTPQDVSARTQTRPVSRAHGAVAAREGPVDTVSTRAHPNPPGCQWACALHHTPQDVSASRRTQNRPVSRCPS